MDCRAVGSGLWLQCNANLFLDVPSMQRPLNEWMRFIAFNVYGA